MFFALAKLSADLRQAGRCLWRFVEPLKLSEVIPCLRCASQLLLQGILGIRKSHIWGATEMPRFLTMERDEARCCGLFRPRSHAIFRHRRSKFRWSERAQHAKHENGA